MENYKKQLEESYSNIFNIDRNNPEWAVKKKTKKENIHPAIPFVGNFYENTKILLYASAENLTYYEEKQGDNWLDDDYYAINRRKISNGHFFPHIHIAPINDGSLLIVAAYILNKWNINLNYSTPYEFIENVAIDNFCKFSLKTSEKDRKNKDYAKDINKLKFSFDYIKSDLEILQPNILALPKTIYGHDEVKKMIKEILPNCLILPIYQINSSTINRIIAKKYDKKGKEEIPETLLKWQKNLSNGITGKTNLNFYSIYNYIDSLFENK